MQRAGPKFVSQWLTGVLTNGLSEPNVSIKRITKKVKDEVVDEDTDNGEYRYRDDWLSRRSPMWTAARVVLQILLINTNDEELYALLLYKLVVLLFLCTFLESKFIDTIDTDSAMQMLAKSLADSISWTHSFRMPTPFPTQ